MSTLRERLGRIREGFRAQAPASVLEIMARATETLERSGIMERVPRVGSTVPPFALPDTDGRAVRSADLLARGPLVALFYRGEW